MKRSIKWVITITLLLIVVVLVYYKAVNGDKIIQDDTTVLSDKDKLLGKDYVSDFPDTVEDVLSKIDSNTIGEEMESDYPLTVCQVVSLFTKIQRSYYNEDNSEKELIKLAYMATILFDKELIDNNPFDEYFEELQEEIEGYQDDNRIISRVIVGKSSDVKYSTVDEKKYASVECIYYVQNDSGTMKNVTTYILRKDEDGKWRILGWQLYQPDPWEA